MRQTRETNYAFDLFETEANAAVKHAAYAEPVRRRQPQPQPKERISRVEKKKSAQQIRQENRRAAVLMIGILTVAAIVMTFWCIHINEFAKQYELSRKIADVQAEIDAAKSEQIRLNSTLNNLTGVAQVEAYATKELGMVLPEGYQIKYIDLSGGDQVLFTAGTDAAGTAGR